MKMMFSLYDLLGIVGLVTVHQFVRLSPHENMLDYKNTEKSSQKSVSPPLHLDLGEIEHGEGGGGGVDVQHPDIALPHTPA